MTALAWYRDASPAARRSLWAAQLGWMLDAMDVMLFAFSLTAIQREFLLSSGQAGALASATLLTSAAGGAVAGILADRYGRARVLVWSILVYSIFTAFSATAQTVVQLAAWRALVGLGLGAEWSAGSVLVAETWPPRHRGKAIGLMQAGWALGYILAALLSAAILPHFGWRALFLAGVLPALLAVWVRRNVSEPAIWLASRARPLHAASSIRQIFSPALLPRTLTATALTTSLLFAYWGLFTWIPSYLSASADRGGAGLGIVRSSAWVVPMQIGAFLGYTLFGILADRFGRRPVFLSFVIAAALLVPAYGGLARSPIALMALGPFIGFFGHGYFSLFGAMLAELFPTAVRAAAQGLCYNFGRAVSALAPWVIGWLADRHGIGSALAVTSAFFALGGALIFFLPETRGKALE
jgi:MFS family permease